METNVIYNEECLQGMEERIPDSSIDMILADLPYGTTACKWDSIIPLEPLWEQYKRVVKDDTAIVLFGQEPFSSKLRMSNIDWFRYDWIWEKTKCGNFLNANRQPKKLHEKISIFYRKQPTYNPQKTEGEEINYKFDVKENEDRVVDGGGIESKEYTSNKRFPKTIIKFSNGNYDIVHPTQKPIPLFKYLIATYTNEEDVVLDNVMGSGTTAVAARALNRNYIGFEKSEEYYKIAQERVSEVQKELI